MTRHFDRFPARSSSPGTKARPTFTPLSKPLASEGGVLLPDLGSL
jgi:hypothetical protein